MTQDNNAADDDILETALTFGVKPAMERYQVSRERVNSVVTAFINDTGGSVFCQCDIDFQNGIPTMCFFCNGPRNRYKFRP